MRIDLPPRLNIRALESLAGRWPYNEPHICVRFHPDQWADPSGIVGLACLIDGQKRRGGTVELDYASCGSIGYWERMQFFTQLDFPAPPPTGRRHAAGDRFVELERIDDIDLVDSLTEKLVVVASADTNSRKILSHIVSEAMNNAAQHSHSFGFAAAQYLPTTKRVEFCIADSGVGLRDSLSSVYQAHDDSEAIRLALQPGVTSNPPQRGQRHMRNRGVGLTCIHRLTVASAGSINVWSGHGRFRSSSQDVERSQIEWRGTLICANLPRDEISTNFADIMREIAQELDVVEKARRR